MSTRCWVFPHHVAFMTFFTRAPAQRMGYCRRVERARGPKYKYALVIATDIAETVWARDYATVEAVDRVESMGVLRIKAACFNQDREQVVSTTMVAKVTPC